MPYLHAGSLEIMLTVPLRCYYSKAGAQLYSMGPSGVGYGYWGAAAGKTK